MENQSQQTQDIEALLTQIATEAASKAAEAANKAAEEASVRVANDMLAQIPALIDKMLLARLEQMNGGAAAQMTQPAAPQASGQGQPATAGSAGMSGMIQQLGPVLLQSFLASQQQQKNPVEAMLQQVEMIGGLIGAIDRIRGPAGSGGGSPKTTLDWAKWGYQLGKSGSPMPEFESVTIKQPPGSAVEG